MNRKEWENIKIGDIIDIEIGVTGKKSKFIVEKKEEEQKPWGIHFIAYGWYANSVRPDGAEIDFVLGIE
jgi:formylmethanofuran dehydrogenase subunit D